MSETMNKTMNKTMNINYKLKQLILVLFAILLVLTVVLLGLVATADSSEGHVRTTHRTFMLRLATTPNEERSDLGLPTLKFDRGMNTAAQHHADQMCATDRLYHSSDIMTGAPSDWAFVGENVGRVEKSRSNKVEALRVAFNNSPTHRALIVSPLYNRIGFGTCKSAIYRYVVYRFSD